MKVKSLAPTDPDDISLCDRWLVGGLTSFDELLQLLKERTQGHPGQSVLITLDDLDQAQYTSGHATGFHDLDSAEGHDLVGVDASAFENGEHRGYLSTPSEFFIRHENFERRAQACTFDDACKRGLTIDDDEVARLALVHADPLAFIDSEVILHVVPVASAHAALCAFPNGYFSSDLNPFETHALAAKLSAHGYELFGIGASLVGFVRSRDWRDGDAESLGVDLARLYNGEQSDSAIKRLVGLAQENKVLFLKYVEYLEG
ncbi:MAG: hypothetical protein RLZZ618_1391 [Pseudomonadota bacterium]|jgi:hypothetical protein